MCGCGVHHQSSCHQNLSEHNNVSRMQIYKTNIITFLLMSVTFEVLVAQLQHLDLKVGRISLSQDYYTHFQLFSNFLQCIVLIIFRFVSQLLLHWDICKKTLFVKGVFVAINAIDHGFRCEMGFDHSFGHHQPLVSTIF